MKTEKEKREEEEEDLRPFRIHAYSKTTSETVAGAWEAFKITKN